MKGRHRTLVLASSAFLLLASCGRSGGGVADSQGGEGVSASDIRELTFVDRDGKSVAMNTFLGDKNVLLVFTRGNTSYGVCPICSTQTTRLISKYEEFKSRNTEVVVVFPVQFEANAWSANGLTPGKKKANVPFPILLDTGLKAVDRLGIRHDLAKPSTYIIDKSGQIQFSYVGKSVPDRPSIKVLLDQLDAINKESA
jgi:peroxiredoxin